jgi:Inward rectifier potassium channel C-terminal domain
MLPLHGLEVVLLQELPVAGGDRLCLRLPTLVCHVIDEDSPLVHWAESSGILLDADSEVVVVVSCQSTDVVLS